MTVLDAEEFFGLTADGDIDWGSCGDRGYDYDPYDHEDELGQDDHDPYDDEIRKDVMCASDLTASEPTLAAFSLHADRHWTLVRNVCDAEWPVGP